MHSVTRRGVLRGSIAGAVATVGLPILNCHLNNNGDAFAAGASLPVCFGHWYQSLGFNPGMWVPKKVGADYENNVQLKVLDPLRHKINIVSGMRYFLDGRPHETHTSTPQIATTGAVFDGGAIGPSLDMKIADVIGTRTRFRSLEVSFDGSRKSWSRRSGGSANPAETSPLALYARVFGPDFKDPNAATFTPDPIVMARKSALSYVTDQRNDLLRRVDSSDRTRLDEYFTSVRELEQQLALELQKPAPMPACSVPASEQEARPGNILEDIMQNGRLFSKLLVTSMACGQTRVANLQTGTSPPSWRRAGSSYNWHVATHEESVDPRVGYQKEVFRFLTSAIDLFGVFLTDLDAVKEGDKTLLDRTLVLWQTDHEDARTHSIENIPIMTAGGAGGRMKTGIHVSSPGDPCTRVGLTVQQVMGVPINEWGDRSNKTSRTVTELVGNGSNT